MEKYNGWTNYETWLVNLWLTNDEGSDSYMREMAQECMDATEANDACTHEEVATDQLSKQLFSYVEEMAEQWMPDQACMFADFINASLSSVNWHEIAQSLIEETESETECA